MNTPVRGDAGASDGARATLRPTWIPANTASSTGLTAGASNSAACAIVVTITASPPSVTATTPSVTGAPAAVADSATPQASPPGIGSACPPTIAAPGSCLTTTAALASARPRAAIAVAWCGGNRSSSCARDSTCTVTVRLRYVPFDELRSSSPAGS